MKRVGMILLALLLVIATTVFAQYRKPASNATLGGVTPVTLGIPLKYSGLLDVSKLRMNHNFSSGYSSSNSGNSLSALYLNTMTYQVNPKFQWIGAVGYGGTAMNTLPGGQTGGTPCGMVGFNWQPKQNVWISATFSRNLYSTGSDRFDHFGWDNDRMFDVVPGVNSVPGTER